MLWLLSRLCLPPAPAPSSVLGELPGVGGAPVGPSSSCSQVALIPDGSEPSLKGGELVSALIGARFDGSGSCIAFIRGRLSLSPEFTGVAGSLLWGCWVLWAFCSMGRHPPQEGLQGLGVLGLVSDVAESQVRHFQLE